MNKALKPRNQAMMHNSGMHNSGAKHAAGLHTAAERPLNWRKKMSDNVALALIAYTGLHIFATVGAIKATGMKSLALFALMILVIGIIPACRWFEKRWIDLSDQDASDENLAGDFRRDQIFLWLMALGLPFLITSVFRVFG
jgi:hypothetical protein